MARNTVNLRGYNGVRDRPDMARSEARAPERLLDQLSETLDLDARSCLSHLLGPNKACSWRGGSTLIEVAKLYPGTVDIYPIASEESLARPLSPNKAALAAAALLGPSLSELSWILE